MLKTQKWNTIKLDVFKLTLRDTHFLEEEDLEEADDDDIITREDLLEHLGLYFGYDNGILQIAELLFHSGLKYVVVKDLPYSDSDTVRIDLMGEEIEVIAIEDDGEFPILGGNLLWVLDSLITRAVEYNIVVSAIEDAMVRQLKKNRDEAKELITSSYWV